GDVTAPIDCTIYSLETWTPFSSAFPARDIAVPRDIPKIAILRDYYNTQASIIRFSQKHGWARNLYRLHKTLWPHFAGPYLERPDDFIVYNRWVEDRAYCRSIENRYGWNSVPRGMTLPASGIGFGSSFDGLGDLRHAELNRRWMEMDAADPAWSD